MFLFVCMQSVSVRVRLCCAGVHVLYLWPVGTRVMCSCYAHARVCMCVRVCQSICVRNCIFK